MERFKITYYNPYTGRHKNALEMQAQAAVGMAQVFMWTPTVMMKEGPHMWASKLSIRIMYYVFELGYVKPRGLHFQATDIYEMFSTSQDSFLSSRMKKMRAARNKKPYGPLLKLKLWK